MKIANWKWFTAGGAALAMGVALGVACSPEDPAATGTSTEAVSQAAFTTCDATLGGCLDNRRCVPNCNHYAGCDLAHMNGGPRNAQLRDGTYFFVVLQPGGQNHGLADNTRKNLSCPSWGTCDARSNRTFTMSGGILKYGGTHATGFDPHGRPVIRLWPFNQTPNRGGVYILAVCKGNRGPRDCKYDAFKCKVRPVAPPPGEQPPGGEQPPTQQPPTQEPPKQQ